MGRGLTRLTDVTLLAYPPRQRRQADAQILLYLQPRPATGQCKPHSFTPKLRRRSVPVFHRTPHGSSVGALHIFRASPQKLRLRSLHSKVRSVRFRTGPQADLPPGGGCSTILQRTGVGRIESFLGFWSVVGHCPSTALPEIGPKRSVVASTGAESCRYGGRLPHPPCRIIPVSFR